MEYTVNLNCTSVSTVAVVWVATEQTAPDVLLSADILLILQYVIDIFLWIVLFRN
jgi:hypothetical protein